MNNSETPKSNPEDVKEQDRATTRAQEDVAAALVPICRDMAETDPERAQTLATIRSASTDQRRRAVLEARWVKLPRVLVRERNGIWEVRVDGIFRGDYHREEHALTAAAHLGRFL